MEAAEHADGTVPLRRQAQRDLRPLYVTRVVDRDGTIMPETVELMARDVDQYGNFK